MFFPLPSLPHEPEPASARFPLHAAAPSASAAAGKCIKAPGRAAGGFLAVTAGSSRWLKATTRPRRAASPPCPLSFPRLCPQGAGVLAPSSYLKLWGLSPQHCAGTGQPRGKRGCGIRPGDPEAERGWPSRHPARHFPFSPVVGRNHAKPQGFDATQGRKTSSARHGKKKTKCVTVPPASTTAGQAEPWVLPQTLRVWGKKGLIWDPCGSWPSQRHGVAGPQLLWDAQPQDRSAGTSWVPRGAGIETGRVPVWVRHNSRTERSQKKKRRKKWKSHSKNTRSCFFSSLKQNPNHQWESIGWVNLPQASLSALHKRYKKSSLLCLYFY